MINHRSAILQSVIQTVCGHHFTGIIHTYSLLLFGHRPRNGSAHFAYISHNLEKIQGLSVFFFIKSVRSCELLVNLLWTETALIACDSRITSKLCHNAIQYKRRFSKQEYKNISKNMLLLFMLPVFGALLL